MFNNLFYQQNILVHLMIILTNDLKHRHKQQRLAWGVSTQNELIEIFTTDNKDSWTIIFTNTNGLSCGLVGGEQGLIFK